jgi:hypothetical protein
MQNKIDGQKKSLIFWVTKREVQVFFMAKKKFPLKYTNVLLHCCWSKIGTVFSKKHFFWKTIGTVLMLIVGLISMDISFIINYVWH